MSKKNLTRNLIAVDYITGRKGQQTSLFIGHTTLMLVNCETGEPLHNNDIQNPLYWHPLNLHGLPIDGIIRIEKTLHAWFIKVTTNTKIRTQTEFVWLRTLAEELHTKGIRYEPLLRKDSQGSRCIIDVVKIPFI